jgi:hypothetical protein
LTWGRGLKDVIGRWSWVKWGFVVAFVRIYHSRNVREDPCITPPNFLEFIKRHKIWPIRIYVKAVPAFLLNCVLSSADCEIKRVLRVVARCTGPMEWKHWGCMKMKMDCATDTIRAAALVRRNFVSAKKATWSRGVHASNMFVVYLFLFLLIKTTHTKRCSWIMRLFRSTL